MMTKKEFGQLMNDFIALKEDEDNLNVAFRKLEPDFNYMSFGRYESLIVRALKSAVGDTSENDWIGYWLYECDYGKDAANKVTDKNGKNIPIETTDELYDYISKLNKSKSKKKKTKGV